MLLIVLAVALGCAAPASAQSTCGGLLQPPCPEPTPAPTPSPTPAPTPTPTPAPAPAPALSAERFSAFEEVLVASNAVEAGTTTAAELRRYRSACRALSTGDPLLRGYRRLCLVDIEGYEYDGLATCRSARSCERASRKIVSLLTRTTSASRAHNRVAAKEIDDKRCRAAVRIEARTIRVVEQYTSAFGQLATAYRKDSRRLFRRAIARLDRIDKQPRRSGATQLKQFRADCR